MTDNHHPITPPPELVQQWARYATGYNIPGTVIKLIATQAARWGADQQLKLDAEQINQAWQKGADQELEACCAWVEREIGHGREWGAELRTTRRPKPPSLKERIATAISHGDNSIALALLDQALPD